MQLPGYRKNKIYIIYTALFIIMAIGVFAILIATNRSFIQYGDAYRQGYFRVVEYKGLLSDIVSGRGFHIWSWDKGAGMEYSLGFFTDPFNLIAALFPSKYIELGVSVAALIRMYLAGFVFLVFGRSVELSDIKMLIGALCYTFSGWLVAVSVKQNQFALNMVLFPLLILGIEQIYRKRSSFLFTVMVAYYMIWSVYFAYMAAIVAIIYFLARAVFYKSTPYPDYEFNFKIIFGKFISGGMLGAALSMIIFLPSLQQMFLTSTESSQSSSDLLFNTFYYSDIIFRIFGRGRTDDYMDFGIPIIILILLIASFMKISLKNTPQVMVGLLSLFYVIPFACRLMNGMSYATTRWVFTLIFFAIWAGVDKFEYSVITEKAFLRLLLLSHFLVAALMIALELFTSVRTRITDVIFLAVQFMASLTITMSLILLSKNRISERLVTKVIICLTVISLSIGWSFGFNNKLNDFKRHGEVYNQLQESAFRAASKLEDDGFYRIDSATGIDHNDDIALPVNESLYWRINQTYIYNSRLPSKWLFLNKAVGNNRGYNQRVAVVTNDNRTGLDYLFGVKYFLGNDKNYEKSSVENESDKMWNMDYMAGCGFEPYKEIDGVSVFKSKYDTSIGFVFNKVLPESEFMSLSRLEREEALLQAVVVPDDQLARIENSADYQIISASDIIKDIENVEYEIASTDNIIVSENKFTVGKGGGDIILHFEEQSDGQLIFSFDNLRKTSKGSKYSYTLENEYVSRTASRLEIMQSMPNIVDFDNNLGCYNNGRKTSFLKIHFDTEGDYIFDRMYISAMHTGVLDSLLKTRENNLMKVTDCSDSQVLGKINQKEKGILMFALPSNTNWEYYVNGAKASVIRDVDIAFVAISVDEGEHEVAMKYRNKAFEYGSLISVIALLLAMVSYIRSRKLSKTKL